MRDDVRYGLHLSCEIASFHRRPLGFINGNRSNANLDERGIRATFCPGRCGIVVGDVSNARVIAREILREMNFSLNLNSGRVSPRIHGRESTDSGQRIVSRSKPPAEGS